MNSLTDQIRVWGLINIINRVFLFLVNRFGDLRNSNDPLLTFEGDNNVLIQQTSNHLFTAYEDFLKNGQVPDTPLDLMNFLKRFESMKIFKLDLNEKSLLLNKTSESFSF